MNFTPFRVTLPLRAASLLAALFCFAVPAMTASEGVGEYIATIIVPDGLSSSQVEEAVVNTLVGREWGVKSRNDGVVVGYLKHRSNEATVTLSHDASKVDIHCVGWEINKKTGERRKPEQPRGWLKNIQTDLTKHLNKAASAN